MSDFLYPAGLDGQDRPVLVVDTVHPGSSALLLSPDAPTVPLHPSHHKQPLSLDDAVQYGVKLLEGMVGTGDFVVVWLATPAMEPHSIPRPPLSTLYRFYRSLAPGYPISDISYDILAVDVESNVRRFLWFIQPHGHAD
jgi:hypothetical protein